MKAEITKDTGFRKSLHQFLHPRDAYTPKIIGAEMNGNVLSIRCRNDGPGVYRLWEVFPDRYTLTQSRTKVLAENEKPVITVKNPVEGEYKVDLFYPSSSVFSYLSHETVVVADTPALRTALATYA